MALAIGIAVRCEGCGGQTKFLIERCGDTFGWAAWVRPDRISEAGRTIEACHLVIVDLSLLNDKDVLTRLGVRMIQNLYARLQEAGICPPNLQAYLRMGETVAAWSQL